MALFFHLVTDATYRCVDSRRRRATRTRTSLHQVEQLNVFSKGPIKLPRRKRAVYTTGALSNEGDILGPIMYEQWSKAWTLPFGIKKVLFGRNRREVGGTTEAEEINSDEEGAEDVAEEEGDVR